MGLFWCYVSLLFICTYITLTARALPHVVYGLITPLVEQCKAKKGIPAGQHWARYGPCYLLLIATVLVLVQPTCMLVIGAYGSDDDTMPCPSDDASEPVNTHHGMENFFFEGDDTNYIVPNTTVRVYFAPFSCVLFSMQSIRDLAIHIPVCVAPFYICSN